VRFAALAQLSSAELRSAEVSSAEPIDCVRAVHDIEY